MPVLGPSLPTLRADGGRNPQRRLGSPLEARDSGLARGEYEHPVDSCHRCDRGNRHRSTSEPALALDLRLQNWHQ